MPEFRDLVYVNESKLKIISEQVFWTKSGLQDWSLNVPLLFGELRLSGRNSSTKEMTISERIDKIIKLLEKREMLSRERPETIRDSYELNAPLFTLEECRATKVILPIPKSSSLSQLGDLVVWISDPPTIPNLSMDNSWTKPVTFLYLVESNWDDGKFTSPWSGCSALQAVVNILSGEPLFSVCRGGEPFGRDDFVHPINKLRRIGAYATDERKIVTLYKRRLISDEQCALIGDHAFRLHDLLGYPLFIEVKD